MRQRWTVALVAIALGWAQPAWPADDAQSKPSIGERISGAATRLKEQIKGERTDREHDPVKAAQRALHDRGFDPGPVDGRLGRKTVDAVKAFQKSEGLKVTGRLDAPTMDRLRSDRTTGSASPRTSR